MDLAEQLQRKFHPHEVGCAVNLAIQKRHKIVVWPKSHIATYVEDELESAVPEKLSGKIERLKKGDIMIVHGNCIHAGEWYDQNHHRGHFYLDTKACQGNPDAIGYPADDWLLQYFNADVGGQ